MQTVERVETPTSVEMEGQRAAPASNLPTILWTAGIAVMLVRVAVGHWRVRSLFGAAEEIRDARWLALSGEIAAEIRLRRRIALKRSTATDVPLSYGLFHSTVLLPGDANHWGDERRRVVLLHEMVHARRLDSLWGLMAQVSVALNWFHPLAWLAWKQFRRERERSCDDAVVIGGTASTVYAAHLVDVARSVAIPEAAMGMAEAFDLEGRIRALLDPSRNRRAVGRGGCTAMMIVALALAVPLGSMHAQAPVTMRVSTPEATVPQAQVVAVVRERSTSPSPKRPARASSPVREEGPEPQAAAKASISGVVSDPSGAVVPGASLTLKNTAAPGEEVAIADAVRQFKMSGLAAGQYLLKVSFRGFASYQKTLTVEAGTSANLNVNLALGDVSEYVEIVGRRPQPAPAPNATPLRIRVGGNVQAVNLIHKVNPAFPADAMAEGIEGTVMLRAVISKDGDLLHIVPVSNSADPRFVRAAMAAVPLWRYKPTLLNGEPAEVITTIAVSFRLN